MIKTVYIYRSGGLGDVIWLEPVLEQLTFKFNKVVLFTNFYELFENHPNKKIKFKKIPSGIFRTYLKFLNLLTNNKTYFRLDGKCYEGFPKMHILNAYQSYLGVSLTKQYPKLYLSNHEISKKIIDNENYVILHLEPNAKLNFRKIYGINWEEVVKFINNLKFKTIVVGTEQIEILGAINFKGTIRDLISVIGKAKFFIGVDSGPSHIAASLQIPSIIFFGSVNYNFRHFAELFNGTFMQQPCEFAGCYHEVISGKGQTCKLVGDTGIPKCCLHSLDDIISKIIFLIEKYKINA